MAKALVSLGLFLLLTACNATTHEGSALKDEEQSPSYSLSSAVYDLASLPSPNRANGDYFSLSVPFGPVNAVKDEIEANVALELKDRGEAHVTLLTPPEVQALKSKLSGSQILAAIQDETLQDEAIEIKCVGSGSKVQNHKTMRAFFLVVHSDGLVQRRRDLAAAFQAAGGAPSRFEAEHFYPHVTIGFTHSDLHEQDGVIKDERACVAPVVILP